MKENSERPRPHVFRQQKPARLGAPSFGTEKAHALRRATVLDLYQGPTAMAKPSCRNFLDRP